MLAKARVFYRQHGLLHQGWNLRQGQVLTPLGAELRDLFTVGGVDLQRQFGLVMDDAVQGRQIEGRGGDRQRHDGGGGERQDDGRAARGEL